MKGAEGDHPPLLGSVQRTVAGWEARLPGPAGSRNAGLLIGVFASRSLAAKALDILRLSSGLATGQAAEAIPLDFPLQDYMDEQTASELRSYDLPSIVEAVKSYAIGGARAPACGVVDDERVPDDDTHGTWARSAPGGGDDAAWRGITRDNNGRQQYWIALLYACLDKEKRPVPPAQHNKTSLYVTCCKTAREAAVAHDLAVVWWRVGCTAAYPQGAAEQQQQQGGQQGAAGGGGEGRAQDGAAPPPAAQQQQREGGGGGPVQWDCDPATLRQLNFPPDMYAGNHPLMRQLLHARTLADLRALISQLRNSGGLAKLAAGSRALRGSPPSDGGAPGGAAAAARRAARKPGGAAPGAELPGKHGRLHDKPYMGLVRDRQITLHPWRPMICAVVEGHSKPQPRSLASCATAEEAAVARDLGWIWLWKRNLSMRQHASLNFALQSYEEHGGTVLEEVGSQPSLEGLRSYLRALRDSGKLLDLATSLERSLGRLEQPRVEPVAATAAHGARVARPPRAAGHSERPGGGEGIDEDVAAAEEMLHMLDGGAGSGDGGSTASGSPSGSGSESESAEDAGAIEASSDEEFKPRMKKRREKGKKRRRSPGPPADPRFSSEPRPAVQPRYFGPQQHGGLRAGGGGGGDPQSASLRSLLGLAAEAGLGGGGGALRSPAAPTLHSSPGGFAATTPPAAALPPEGLGSESYEEGGAGPSGGTTGRFVGVQHISGSKQASKTWIPRPTVRVPGSDQRLASKQLTLCYCDSAEEAAVARDVATIWNWQQLGGQEHGGQQRLNFPLARYQAQPGLLHQLAAVQGTEAMQALTKELRDTGVLRTLAAALGSPGAGGASPSQLQPPAGGGGGGGGGPPLARQLSIEVPMPPEDD